MADASKLLELAKEKYEISAPEEKLFRDTVNGEMADYSAKDTKAKDPAEADGWRDERILRASRIAWLCTDKQASQLITHRGIVVKGARIDEEFNLEAAKVPFPLWFEQCKFTANINFRHMHTAALYMQGTHTGTLWADGLTVEGSVHLRTNFIAKGEVCLCDAQIGRNLDCDNSLFINSSGKALSADRLRVEGCVYCRKGFTAEGEVCLLDAQIGGSLECIGGRFLNRNGKALLGDRLKIGGSVFLREGFRAEGEVRLVGAMIGGDLDCDKGQFINERGKALSADRLKVEGGVYFRKGFKAEGEVCLFDAQIGGGLDCIGGCFVNRDEKALSADRLKIEGSIFLREHFTAEGEVRLLSAAVGGDLDCGKGQFINKDGKALNADGLKVKGHVFLRKGFMADGTVSFVGATVDKHFSLYSIDSPELMTLDLATANVGTLHDKEDGWPPQKHLILHGFEYKEISHESPSNSKTRIDWLRRQDSFWPQPYEQLAKVLRESGDDTGAKDVLIAKNKDKAQRTRLTRAQWLWYHLLGPLIGYGYKPLRAVPIAIGIVLLGWILFGAGYSSGLITPPGDSAYTTTEKFPVPDPGDRTRGISTVYPVFNSLVYSIDVFVPVVDFHQAEHWLPNANRGSKLTKIGPWPLHTGGLLLFWLWVETVFGWVISTLFIVSLTGLVRT